MKYTNRALPPFYGEHFIRALQRDPYDPGDAWMSNTALIGPPMIRALRKKHADELSQDVLDSLWSLMGQALHHVLQRGDGDESFTEERLYAEFDTPVGKKRISGAFDLYGYDPTTKSHIVADWKFTSVWAFIFEKDNDGVKPEWEAQLNVLAELLRRNGFAVDKLDICAILKDWSRTKAQEDPNYPQSPVIVMSVPMWKSEHVIDYISERCAIHHEYEVAPNLDEMPVCMEEERWQKPSTFKVQKDGRTIAGGVKTTYREAQELVDKLAFKGPHTILKVPGKDVRCEDYCIVRQFCRHGRAKKEE